MDCMSNDTASYVLAQAGKQFTNIIHLNDLASYKEHDTKRSIPGERERERVESRQHRSGI